MPKYARIRVRDATKDKLEEMKPHGVAMHVLIDYMFESMMANDPNINGDPESWVDDLFGAPDE